MRRFNLKKDIFFVKVSSGSADSAREMLVKMLSKGRKGIYITLNKPHPNVKSVFFIDSVSNRKKSCHFCIHEDVSSSLTGLSILISSKVDSSVFKMLVLDSVSSLLVYNNKMYVERFVRFLSNKLRNLGMKGFFLFYNDKSSEDLIRTLSEIADEVIVS